MRKLKWKDKVPPYTIDESLGKYRNGKRVLEKLAEANKMIAKTGLPDIYYERQAEIEAKGRRYDTALFTQELAVAHEPQPEYNAPKQEEK